MVSKSNKKENRPVTIQLVRMRLDRFHLESFSEILDCYGDEAVLDLNSLVYDFKTKLHFKLDDNLVLCVLTTTVKFNSDKYKPLKDADCKLQVAALEVQYDFEVQELSSYIDESDNVNLPNLAFTTMNSLAVSTLRGIWFEKSATTYLGPRVMPIINPQLFKRDDSE